MLALRLYRARCCPNCGGNLDVTAASENEDRFRHQPPLQCFRCVGFSRSHEEFKDEQHPLSYLHLVPQSPGVS